MWYPGRWRNNRKPPTNQSVAGLCFKYIPTNGNRHEEVQKELSVNTFTIWERVLCVAVLGLYTTSGRWLGNNNGILNRFRNVGYCVRKSELVHIPISFGQEQRLDLNEEEV